MFARVAASYGKVPLWDFNRFSPFRRSGSRREAILDGLKFGTATIIIAQILDR